MSDYNIRYYNCAIDYLKDMKYYSGDLIGDCTQCLLRYFPHAEITELQHAITWALADAWGGGCEMETL